MGDPMTGAAVGTRESYLAVRVLNALLRENYGGLAGRVTRTGDGVALDVPGGAAVRLAPGGLFQDFVVAPGEPPGLDEVLRVLTEIADPADAAGVAAFTAECHQTLAALELHDQHRDAVLARLRAAPPCGTAFYDTLAAFVDHPVYPTARCRLGLSDAELLAYAPEFAPSFELRWAAVPAERVVRSREGAAWWPSLADAGLPGRLAGSHTLFPVHPLTVPAVRGLPGVVVGRAPYLTVRPTLSMRTVEVVAAREHLKLPLTTSTLGLRNRRSIRPAALRDGALAERLLRRVLDREPDLRVELADEQTYAHAGHEYLAWLLRRHPPGEPGEIVSVAALPAPSAGSRRVVDDLADRYGGGDPLRLLKDYLTLLFRWNVRLFVKYGVALEAHQQNLALVLGRGSPGLLVKDNDGLLASPDGLRAAGLDVPPFADERMLTDDPHALADVFVTITLHLAAAAIAFAVAAEPGGPLVRDALAAALAEHGEHPMARLLRARTLDAARLVGKSMVTAGTLVDKARSGARDVNKFYGTSGPNYLRHPPRTFTP
jgi:hypothetical protein